MRAVYLEEKEGVLSLIKVRKRKKTIYRINWYRIKEFSYTRVLAVMKKI